MRQATLLILALALVSVTVAQKFRCVMPQQWEASQFKFDPNGFVGQMPDTLPLTCV